MRNSRGNINLVLVILAVVLLLGVFAFSRSHPNFFKKFFNKNEANNTLEITYNVGAKDSSYTQEKTLSWKTYTNNRHKYEIKYPPDMLYQVDSGPNLENVYFYYPQDKNIGDGSPYFKFLNINYTSYSSKSISEVMTSNTGDASFVQKVEFNNVTGYQILGGNDYFVTSKDQPGIILRISTYAGGARSIKEWTDFELVVALMLSTFHFTQ